MALPTMTRRALLGAACGDAFGAPFEYHPHAADLARMSLLCHRYIEHSETKVSPDRARVPGMYTDDTQQAMLLILAKRKHSNSNDAREFFYSSCFKMLRSGGSPHGTHRGTGSNFREAIRTGKPLDTAGLGAAMRVAPFATMFSHPQEVVVWVTEMSTVTTYNPVSIACAIKVGLAAWVLAHRRDREWIHDVGYPGAVSAPLGSNQKWYARFPKSVWDDTVKALKASKNGSDALMEFGYKSGYSNRALTSVTDGFALTGFAWAIRCAFEARSFEDALLMASEPGGDTDTICAITGALAAMRFDIPEWMLDGMVKDPTDPEHITSFRDFNRIEHQMTRKETDLRASLHRAS